MMMLDCGHNATETDSIGTGFARIDNKKVCYPCATLIQRADLVTADEFTAYVSCDGTTITTWNGDKLGGVQQISNPIYTPTGGAYHIIYAKMNGVEWWGRGGGEGMYVNLKRCK